MFRKLLVPLDSSQFAEQALARAVEIARDSGAAIHLVLVHQAIPYGGFSDIPWSGELADAEAKYLHGMGDQLAAKQIVVTAAALEGNPVEMICREAVRTDCDLIVMASHGRTGLSRFWLGSVSSGVIRNSTVPVFLARPSEKTHENIRLNRILVTLDGSSVSKEIIPFAVNLAQCNHASLTLLRVVQPVAWVSPLTGIPFAYPPMVHDEELTKNVVANAEDEIANVKQCLQKQGHAVDTHVEVAEKVAQAIADYVKAHNIDLVAMSTHGRGASRLFLGSVTDKVLRSVDVPMLLHRPTESGSAGNAGR
jgi:nucleotide-binding universal stress UspA family protein